MQDHINGNQLKSFFSKRNHVTLNKMEWSGHNLPVIIKEFSEVDTAQREYCLLKLLHSLDINVPVVYGINKNIIYLQFIPGTLLTHIIDDVFAYPPDWISHLAEWFYRLHKADLRRNGSIMIKDDCNLRNFIYFDHAFYALDFEDEVYGRPEQDVAECSAYILSNDPSFTKEKFQVVSKFVEYYCQLNHTANRGVIVAEIKNVLKVLAGRRKQQQAYILNSMSLVDQLAAGY